MPSSSNESDAPEAPYETQGESRKRFCESSSEQATGDEASFPPLFNSSNTTESDASKRSRLTLSDDEADRDSTILEAASEWPRVASSEETTDGRDSVAITDSSLSSSVHNRSVLEQGFAVQSGDVLPPGAQQVQALNAMPGLLPQNPLTAQSFHPNFTWTLPNVNPSSEGVAPTTDVQQLAIMQQMMSNMQSLVQQNVGTTPAMPFPMVNPFFANPLGGILYQQYLMNMAASQLGQTTVMVPVGGIPQGPPAGIQGSSSDQGVSSSASQAQQKRTPLLYLPSDDDILSDYQCLLRKQIEFFEAGVEDAEIITPGRRKDIFVGQVGIRCRHCAGLPVHQRKRGTAYFPAKLNGLYQAAQNMAASHFGTVCDNIDLVVRSELQAYNESKSASGHAGKQYWADGARILGLIETERGLRFAASDRSSGEDKGETSTS